MKEEISVRWLNCRGEIILANGEKLAVRAKKVTGNTLTLEGDWALPRSTDCEVAVRFPPREQSPGRVVHARCRVRDAILSASRYVLLVDILAFREGEAPW